MRVLRSQPLDDMFSSVAVKRHQIHLTGGLEDDQACQEGAVVPSLLVCDMTIELFCHYASSLNAVERQVQHEPAKHVLVVVLHFLRIGLVEPKETFALASELEREFFLLVDSHKGNFRVLSTVGKNKFSVVLVLDHVIGFTFNLNPKTIAITLRRLLRHDKAPL